MKRRDFLMAATGVAGGAGAGATAAAAQETTTTSSGNATASGNETTTAANGTASGGQSGGGGPTREVIVGPGGSLTFEPAEITIAPGTTVHWVWESDNHNVVPSSQPDDADWQGTEGAPDATYDTGYEYSYTFEVTGTYEYFCQPHEAAGMTGSITVQEGGASEGGGGPSIPSSAKTLGIATTAAMVFTLGLAYFFMKYGGDYGQAE